MNTAQNTETIQEPAIIDKPQLEELNAKPKRTDLFEKFPLLKKIVKLRSFQFSLILPNLAVFYLIIIAGLVGTPVGNKNIAIVFIWIL